MAKKILIVDDDKNIVEYLTTIFKDNGYETCEAFNGDAALKTLLAEKPDLVTLDLEMPREWGPRFYRKMAQTPEFGETPVIVISGLSGIHLAIKKAVATISKPFDPDEVLTIVRNTIGE